MPFLRFLNFLFFNILKTNLNRRIAVFFFVSIWMLVAMVIAVRTALDYQSTFRAVMACAIGWVIQMTLFELFMPLMG